MLYNERSANVYRRASSVIINNPVPGDGLPPDLRFVEQDVIVEPDGSLTPLHSDVRDYCGVTFHERDRGAEFDLIHPVSGDVVGQATYGDLELMIYSLYFHAATLRDTRTPDVEPTFTPDQIDPTTGLPLEEYQ